MVGKSMGVCLMHLARMTAIFNPFSEAVANIGDHCGWCASMSGHGPSWHSCVGCSQPVHRSTLVDATGARTHMAKLSWHADFVVSVVCRRTQRPSSGSGEAPWVSSRVCHWKVQIFCERIHSVSREPECSRSQIFTPGFSFAAPGDMVCVNISCLARRRCGSRELRSQRVSRKAVITKAVLNVWASLTQILASNQPQRR